MTCACNNADEIAININGIANATFPKWGLLMSSISRTWNRALISPLRLEGTFSGRQQVLLLGGFAICNSDRGCLSLFTTIKVLWRRIFDATERCLKLSSWPRYNGPHEGLANESLIQARKRRNKHAMH